MSDIRLDEDGSLRLPEEVLTVLRWEAGQDLTLSVEGDQLLVRPASRASSLKAEARRVASAMHELAAGAARQAATAVSSLAHEEPPPPPPAPAAPALVQTAPPGAHVGPFQGTLPRVAEGVYLAPGSSVIGDVSLGENASVWAGAVLRGDVAPVRVGARTNIQEGAVVHVSPHAPCVLGEGVTVGHQATVHACTVGNNSLIGIHAVVLDGARIGEHCIVAAGCVVPPGMEVPDGKMVMGVPAKILRDLTTQEIERVHWNADSYFSLKDQYRNPPAPTGAPVPEEPHRKPQPPGRGSLPRGECRRASGPIVVDGSLDEAGWAGVPPLSGLVHSDGSGEPIQHTEVKVCWDETCLYVAFACKDADVWANFEHRDDPLYDEEVVEIFLCPTGDLRHYFEFEVSPANVLFDATVFNPEGDRRTMLVDREWNAAGIRTAVRVAGTLNERASPDLGWIAEVAIPFRDLGLEGPPAPGAVWRANFYRIERGEKTEFTAWSPTYKDPADFHVPACFGELVFVG